MGGGLARRSAGIASGAGTALRRSTAHAGPVLWGRDEPLASDEPMLTLAAVALSALVFGACGTTVSTSGYKGEAEAVAQRVANFQRDVTASEAQKICSEDLSAVVKAKLKAAGDDCEGALKSQLKQIDVPRTDDQVDRSEGTGGEGARAQHVVGQDRGKHAGAYQGRQRWRIVTLQ